MEVRGALVFKFRCPRCGRAEVDRFLKACFSCWLDMSTLERRELTLKTRGSPIGSGTPLRTAKV